VTLIAAAIVLLIGARTLASTILDYQWWRELGQVDTWLSMMGYSVGPGAALTVIAFAVFWIAHARGLKAAGTSLRDHRVYARLTTLALLLASVIFAAAVEDSWTVVRYFGGAGGSGAEWRDPAFGKPLSFYLFELPFYSMLLRAVLALCVVGGLIYYVTTRAWGLATASLPRGPGGEFRIELPDLRALGGLESRFISTLAGVFLIAWAVRLYLDRYDLLSSDHGFMVGVDWVAENVTIPLIWVSIAGSLIAAGLVWTRRWKTAGLVIALFIVARAVGPRVVSTVYVRPNELAIQKQYIHQHIEATRQAYGLNTRSTEKDYEAHLTGKVDVQSNRAMLENVRLWDWRAFHDTVSQIQPLRPYMYADTDVDRYIIDGQLRQVLLSARELDLNQLGDARARWTNPHLVYTHGYGLVLAEANQITQSGSPVLFIENAPPVIHTPSLKLTRPELYYSEAPHEPVFVRTDQMEFNYPSGADNVKFRYDGKGGFPISSLPMRLVASVVYGDWNIALTAQLGSESRMMIHRRVNDRLSTLAGFVHWDADPYLVLTNEGRAVWLVDGYLTSDAHPYSRSLQTEAIGQFNYIRNSVKAVVDAYDGSVHLYVFDPADPLVRAYRNLFPQLFTDMDKMPADLRAHTRYPETIFRMQAEIYRTYHMRDAESFYNKADQWDIARSLLTQEGQAQSVEPSYLVATLPGESSAEFLLMIPFTPRNKDNLIGLMAARCDGAHLGEIVVLLLSKQETIFGPIQVEAQINQDQNISKDLTLWNQQGSQVLRGQMQVLPAGGTFLYVQPIYIQAKEARMPQLKKVVLANGNQLIYADTYQQALAQLAGMSGTPAPAAVAAGGAAPSPPAPAAATSAVPAAGADTKLNAIRNHLQRYRELTSQGRWSEAGKELEAIDGLVKK
jgi:uncharacterized membrane protein (UPF0182 family)